MPQSSRRQQQQPGSHQHYGSTCLDTMWDLMGNKRLRSSAFYCLLMFMATITFYDVFKLIKGYVNDNTDTDMTVEFNETMTMPNLTFCMSKGHAWSFFKPTALLNGTEIDEVVEANLEKMPDRRSFLDNHWDYRMVIDAYQVIASLNSLERETSTIGVLNSIFRVAKHPRLAAFRQSLKKWLGEIQKRKVTFEEFQDKVGRETLKRSLERFQRLGGDPDGRQIRNGIKITWISQMQLCFQPLFDQANFVPIQDQDQFFTLSMAYNSENVEQIDCMSVDVHGRPSSEARFLEGKGRAKDGFFSDLCIGRSYEIDVEVRSVFTSLPDAEEPEKKCRVYEEGDRTEFECRSRCRIEWIRKVGHCTPLTISYLVEPEELEQFPLCDYEKVEIDPQLFNLSNWDKTCSTKCLPDCTQTRYHLRTIQRTAPKKEQIQLTLLWGSFEYLRLSQKEKSSLSKFLASIGGSVNLWLGLCALSTIQFITFLMTRIHKKVVKRRRGGGGGLRNNGISNGDDGGRAGNKRSESNLSDSATDAGTESGGDDFVSTDPTGGDSTTRRH